MREQTRLVTATVMFRSWLGPDLRIVILSMTDQDRRERTLARHAGDEASADTLDVGLGHHQSSSVTLKETTTIDN